MVLEPVIGLEVHVELKTQAKIFCSCPADFFGKPANTQTCPVCLGLPGALPVANKEAIRQALMVGLALNCEVNRASFFERKNYFYPDLPKGFQISQYQKPLSVNGWVELEGQKYRVNRAHLEEDTGKLLHEQDKTLIDFNRCGVPLLEIVSEADFHNAVTAKKYLEKIYEIVRLLGVSEADMEKGSMRLEANVSVQEVEKYRVGAAKVTGVGGYVPNPKVELKNINSFRFAERAINFEIERQKKALENGEKLTQETRGWDEKANKSSIQRAKEEANDYRYFPEPDLPPLKFSEKYLAELAEQVKEKLTSSGENKAKELSEKYHLPLNSCATLVSIPSGWELFEAVEAKKILPANVALNLIINRPDYRVATADEFERIVRESKDGLISSEDQLTTISQMVIEKNASAVRDYKSGKNNAVDFLLGQVMRETKGKALPVKARQILERQLKDGK